MIEYTNYDETIKAFEEEQTRQFGFKLDWDIFISCVRVRSVGVTNTNIVPMAKADETNSMTPVSHNQTYFMVDGKVQPLNTPVYNIDIET